MDCTRVWNTAGNRITPGTAYPDTNSYRLIMTELRPSWNPYLGYPGTPIIVEAVEVVQTRNLRCDPKCSCRGLICQCADRLGIKKKPGTFERPDTARGRAGRSKSTGRIRGCRLVSGVELFLRLTIAVGVVGSPRSNRSSLVCLQGFSPRSLADSEN
eukprot:2886111-Rhodomonas_salina.1